ncbi:MAG: hypothetical protein JWQ35_2336 [Bacteriovoracaceae bacterium]|nr:hypothetical protein [Bacteriovoracaceae bacterium]
MDEYKNKLGIRWTIGDVSDSGFEALRLSVWGAFRAFGSDVSYAIYVNSIDLEVARRKTGDLPESAEWRKSEIVNIPDFLAKRLDPRMAEGVAWKFAPLQAFPDRYELALDNDCILWEVPKTIAEWLNRLDETQCLVAEDVRACFGKFETYCGSQPKNSGIRGLPPQFSLEKKIREMMELHPVRLESELDEQGLQIAALSRVAPLAVVSIEEVSVCSPFPPHMPNLGIYGAHFVGLNAKQRHWNYDGKPAEELTREHWKKWRPEVYRRVGISPT